MDGFKGVIAATITPFTPDGRLNETAFQSVMRSNIQSGVDGFWISGGTGESVLLDEQEVIRTAEISAELCRNKVKTIVHVGALTTLSAVNKAKGAAKAGVDAIACVPPFFYHPTDQTIIDHYKAVVDAAGLPLFVYNQPRYTGVEFTPQMMEKVIHNVPGIIGVKHSAADLNNIYHFRNMGLQVFTGHGSLFLSALTAGAVGVVDGPLTVAPEIWVRIYRNYCNGNLPDAQKAQKQATALVHLMLDFGFYAACKVLTGARLGIDCGNPRLPIPALAQDERDKLLQAASKLGVMVPTVS